MTCYLDTSVLVAALTAEASTSRIQKWLSDKNADELTISDWVVTEFSAALSLKCRRREIDLTSRGQALVEFDLLIRTSFTTLAVSHGNFRTAARLANHPGAGLRGGDALHLAICAGHGATLCTLDHDLYEAAISMGVASIQP